MRSKTEEGSMRGKETAGKGLGKDEALNSEKERERERDIFTWRPEGRGGAVGDGDNVCTRARSCYPNEKQWDCAA